MKRSSRSPILFVPQCTILHLLMSVLMLFFGMQNAEAQSTIYSTNFGTLAVNTDPLLTGGGVTWNRAGTAPTNTQVVTSSASTGGPYFSGLFSASGSGNAGDNGTTTAGAGVEAILTASGINTTGFSSIQVGYIARASSASYTATITFEWSVDGTTWNPITYTNVTYNGTWQAINGGTLIALPAGAANQANLRLRWQFDRTTTGGNYRIDDLFVRGIAATPTLGTSALSNYLVDFFKTTTTPSSIWSFSVNGVNLTNDLVVTAPTGFEVRTGVAPFGSTVTLVPSAGTVATTVIDVQMTATAIGPASGTISCASSPATPVNVSVSGRVVANPAPFTPGNIVVSRIGSGGVALSNAATRFIIDEYTPSGALVQTVSMPTEVSGLNRRLTQSGTATSNGALSLSPDGQYLSVTGYDAIEGSANPTTSSALLVNRIAAIVSYNGTVNTTTRISDGFEGDNVRSSVTADGVGIWVGGNGTGGSGGTRYAVLGSTGTSTQISTSVTNTRVLNIFGGQLYTSANSGAFRIASVGAGVPTTSGQITTNINGGPSDPFGYQIFDLNPSISGLDVMYVSDNAGGLKKYSFDGTAWVANGSLTGTTTGLIGKVTGPNSIELYMTHGTAAGNQIYRLVDNAGHGAAITGNGTAITAAATLICTAPANTVFRGVAFSPEFLPTPEIAHTFSSPGGSNVPQGSTDRILYAIQTDVTVANATLSGVSVTTTGSYVASDFTSFRLYLSTNNVLDGGDALLGTVSTSTGPGQVLNFGSLASLIPVGTRYLFITANVSGCANIGSEINITSTPLTSITYTLGVKTGTPAAGSTRTVTAGAPSDVSAATSTTFTPTLTVSWTNPGCFDDVMVVAHTSSSIANPTLTTYTANSNYSLAPAYPGGGRVVYKSTASTVNVTNLPLGVTYFFKIFTRIGTVWSTGVVVSGFADNVTFYSQASGSANTGAIWSLTPTGTPQTAAALGGFATNKSIVVQSGHIVDLTASGINCLNITVNNGGQLWRNSNLPASMNYFNVFGNITCNGSIGNGTTFDAIGFNIEGLSCSISGNGTVNAGRIRKTGNTNLITTLTFNMDVNIRFPGGAALYNNSDGTAFNSVIPAGRKVFISDPTGDLSFDGTNGTSPERGGTMLVNGTLFVGNKIFALTNNTTQVCSFTIGATGVVNAGSVDADIAGGNGFAFTINTGGKLNLTKILKVFSGTLVSNGGIRLVSTSTGTALVDGTGAGQITGNVTVERMIGPVSGYHYLGSPVAGSFVSTPGNGWIDDFYINPAWDNVIYNPTVPVQSIFPQVWEYDETNPDPNTAYGWKGATGATDAISPMKGFACVVPANTVVDVFGTVNNGPQSIPVTAVVEGFNLLANPYPSPISWTAFRGSNSTVLGSSFQAFVSTGGFAGTYGSWNGFTSVNGVNNIISSSQAFFVTALTNGTASMNNTHRTTDLNPNFYSTPGQVDNLMRLELDRNGRKDELALYFHPTASDGFDIEHDAMKILPLDPAISSLYAKQGNRRFCIEAFQNFNAEQVIPIGIKAAEDGLYTLAVTEWNGFAGSALVYFVDLLNGTSQNLRLNPVVQINLTSGLVENRFQIRFVPGIQLGTSASGCGLNNGSIDLEYAATTPVDVTVMRDNGIVAASLIAFTGSVQINNLNPGNYVVQTTFADGFVGMDHIQVDASNPPVIGVDNIPSLVEQGASSFFSATTNATDVSWNMGDGTILFGAGVAHTYAATGVYQVVATASIDNCTAVLNASVEVSAISGVIGQAIDGLHIFAANGVLTIDAAGLNEPYTGWELMNLQGQKVLSGLLSGNRTERVSLESLADGVYLVRVFGSENQTVKRIFNKR